MLFVLLTFRVVRVAYVSCSLCCWLFVWFMLLPFRVFCIIDVSVVRVVVVSVVHVVAVSVVYVVDVSDGSCC